MLTIHKKILLDEAMNHTAIYFLAGRLSEPRHEENVQL